MDKIKKILCVVLFFLYVILFSTFNFNKFSVYAYSESEDKISLECVCENNKQKYECYFRNENIKNLYLSENLISKLENFGLNKKEILTYLFSNFERVENEIVKNFSVSGKNGEISVLKNCCEINIKPCENYEFINLYDFYEKFFSGVLKGKKIIKINLNKIKVKTQNIYNLFNEKSDFETNFSSSTDERKNNIKKALSKFDGLILDVGESFSFNKVTGIRNKQNGYKEAKIISGGRFISGFGGGVCQVSTTIYNACLLAGLEILEVHNHSLPVSYVKKGFDAMVNSGSSDLVVRNNTNSKILITTSSKNDICRVKIFGIKNKYKIERSSEEIKTIPHGETVYDYNYENYENLSLEIGEEKQVSFCKDGFVIECYLSFYDENGKLVDTKKIRHCVYNPTNDVIVKRLK